MNPITPQFTNRDVLRVLPDLHPDVFQDLVNRRLIEPESERNPGYGKKRMYSAENVLQVAIVHALLDARLTPAVAVEICGRNLLIDRFRRAGKLDFDWLVTACVGRRGGVREIWTRFPGAPKEPTLAELIESAEKNGHPVIAIPVRKIEESVLGRLEEILVERGSVEVG
jgi:hypothetical protein